MKNFKIKWKKMEMSIVTVFYLITIMIDYMSSPKADKCSNANIVFIVGKTQEIQEK